MALIYDCEQPELILIFHIGTGLFRAFIAYRDSPYYNYIVGEYEFSLTLTRIFLAIIFLNIKLGNISIYVDSSVIALIPLPFALKIAIKILQKSNRDVLL